MGTITKKSTFGHIKGAMIRYRTLYSFQELNWVGIGKSQRGKHETKILVLIISVMTMIQVRNSYTIILKIQFSYNINYSTNFLYCNVCTDSISGLWVTMREYYCYKFHTRPGISTQFYTADDFFSSLL